MLFFVSGSVQNRISTCLFADADDNSLVMACLIFFNDVNAIHGNSCASLISGV